MNLPRQLVYHDYNEEQILLDEVVRHPASEELGREWYQALIVGVPPTHFWAKVGQKAVFIVHPKVEGVHTNAMLEVGFYLDPDDSGPPKPRGTGDRGVIHFSPEDVALVQSHLCQAQPAGWLDPTS